MYASESRSGGSAGKKEEGLCSSQLHDPSPIAPVRRKKDYAAALPLIQCTKCHKAVVLRLVSKKEWSIGQVFYCCPYYKRDGTGCQFWFWEDDYMKELRKNGYLQEPLQGGGGNDVAALGQGDGSSSSAALVQGCEINEAAALLEEEEDWRTVCMVKKEVVPDESLKEVVTLMKAILITCVVVLVVVIRVLVAIVAKYLV
ncbi:hypothetical protein BDA96_05G122000 [Sorghum bicolor]|uniref:GRF-type domain-containing protein n=2 Tax=Sorghum bicolor TaxID=4558 RepID=C5Y264_SORBI|nr:hypothetical protein SORBI_3005G110700 [Sorghum bicolor]KAG0529719.1 hypothetical protein BDA96_05G122000 [Sorghum bicolor]